LGGGMLLRLLSFGRARRAGLGQAIAGFGAFFLGVSFMQGAFTDLAPRFGELRLDEAGWLAVPLFVLVGALLTVSMQSSSAAIAVALTAVAGGAAPLHLAAAALIGANIGTT